MRSRFAAVAALAVVAAACSDKALNITNPNAPTVAGAAADPAALQLLASGIISDMRGQRGGFITSTGIFGRESYTFTPQEGRNTTHFLVGIGTGANQKLDNAGFAVGNWGGQYNAMRDIYNFKKTVLASTSLTTAQQNAAIGFARTIEAYMLLQVIATRDTLGAVVEIKEIPSDLAPFVSRDSVYKVIMATFDDAATKLAAGGSAFPFNLTSGFAGFNTPATYLTFNNALKARASAYYASLGGGSWATTLAAVNASFINAAATTRSALDAGVYDVYAASPEASNPLNKTTNTDLYLHMSIKTDVQAGDLRYAAKVGARTARTPGFWAVTSDIGLDAYAGVGASIPEIRNEELILLRSEAKWRTGDKTGAIADLNIVRQNSGGLAASTLTAASTDAQYIAALAYERRLSLFMEGHRWVDNRRWGTLASLPLDFPSAFVAKVMPVPQGECLVRVGKGTALAGPGC